VLFQHGLGVNGQVWLPWLRHMQTQREAYIVDMRGHGLSATAWSAPSYALEDYAQDLVDVLDDCGVERCHVVGESFGGTVCLYLAARHPDRFATVTVCSTGWKGAWINNVPTWEALLKEEGIEAWSASLTSGRFKDVDVPEPLVEWVTAQQHSMDPEIVWQVAKCLLGVDLSTELETLRQPVLTMLGHSPFVDPKNIAEFMNRVPQAECVRIPHAQHGIVMSHPAVCAGEAFAFMERHEPAA
jgi:pimeloyl-ACP methyl ester carboxylesterase